MTKQYVFPHTFKIQKGDVLPNGDISPGDGEYTYFGMSLRQYYAAKAMQAGLGITAQDWNDIPGVVHNSFKIADAMIAYEAGEGK